MEKLLGVYNRFLHASRRRLTLTISGQELPSPKPRMLHRAGYNKIYSLAKALDKRMTITGVTDTNSMEPVIDHGHLALITDKPRKEYLVVGDILLFYRRLDNSPRVLHRIIEIGDDEEGWYCITRGDNTVWIDGKIRYKDILGICVGVIY